MSHVVAIDGPAGAGKSTIARALARALGWRYLNTGATYRALALMSLTCSTGTPTEESAARLADQLTTARYADAEGRIFMDNQDVTRDLYRPDVERRAALLAAYPRVREKLVGLQRGLAEQGDCVVEGRDIGSVVFQSATLKIYLTADAETRARRRQQALREKGFEEPLESVRESVIDRDQLDSSRGASPLVKAPDAVEIDTTRRTPEEILGEIRTELEERLGSRPRTN